MKQMEDMNCEDRWKVVFEKAVPRLIFNFFTAIIVLVHFIFCCYRDIAINVEEDFMSKFIFYFTDLIFIIFFSIFTYWYIKLLIRGKKFIKICKNGKRKDALLTQVVIRNNMFTFFYEYELNNKKIFDKDSCHIVDRDYNVLGIKPKFKENIIIPIMVYQNVSIVLFHECGFMDIAHTTKQNLITQDYIPN